MINRRHAMLLGAAALISSDAVAQAKYPERPIRLVIPFAPAGVADAVGRQWAHATEALLGPIFLENQGGASGLIAAAAVARANPDGYTLLLGSGAQMLVAVTASHPPYDPVRDFAPISILVVTALCIAVNPSVPARTLKELVDYAKANPGKLSYGSAGVGSVSHLAGELFKLLTGTNDIVHVPYKGAGPALADLISGQISMVPPAVTGQVLDWHRSGKVRILAVAAPVRLVAAPEIPTTIEQGLPGMIAQSFMGLFAPAGTDKAIIEQISDVTHIALADQEIREKLIASGFEPYPDSSPEAARRLVDDDIARWTPVIKAIGLKMGMRSAKSERT